MEMRSTDLEERRRGCQACWIAVKQKGKNRQSIGNESVQKLEDKPWTNEELKKFGGSPVKA